MAGATKEALRAATTEQLRKHSRAGRSQTAFSPKTLRAAGLLSVACVCSFLTARCGALRAAKAALATAKIPRRSAPRSFQTGSKAGGVDQEQPGSDRIRPNPIKSDRIRAINQI